jgi:hypothetical protein
VATVALDAMTFFPCDNVDLMWDYSLFTT